MNLVTPIKGSDISPAERLMALTEEDMAAVDALIADRMQSPVGMIPDLADHLISAGGKRLRPMLTVATSRLCGYEGTAHHRLATAVEFIHSATLLHDDVIDESDLRRGKRPANLIWGNAPTILVGDFLFARAFSLMVETQSLDALGILSQASSVITEGEVHQLAALRKMDMDRDLYMQIIGAKTAELFAAACEVSPVIAGSDDDVRQALRTYGMELGLAFQLVDDALDYGGAKTALGKNVGDDFREGKMTLPIILTLEQAGDRETAFWTRVIREREQADGDLERALSYLKGSNALTATLDAARQHARAARQSLSVFPRSELRDVLEDLADYVVTRAS